MLNYIWLGLILFAAIVGGFTGHMQEVTDGAINACKTAVIDIAFPLIGIMTLWLGVMRLAEKAGLVQMLARLLRPVMRWLFPDVPANHPAMGSMILTMAANMLGLNNAATPLGLRAMKDLESLNKNPGVATNAMCTFLALSTSSIQLIPITAIAVLAAAGCKNPTSIIGTSLLATVCSNFAALTAVKLFERLPIFRAPAPAITSAEKPSEGQTQSAAERPVTAADVAPPTVNPIGKFVLLAFVLCFVFFTFAIAFPESFTFLHREPAAEQLKQNAAIRLINSVSLLSIPFLLSFFPLYAFLCGIKVYEEFVDGAKEGFTTATKIIPYLVTMLAAIAMFRYAGGIKLITEALRPVLAAINFPPDLMPMWIMRPLTGSGSFAVLNDIVKQFGGDNIISKMAATVYGSTETTFYIITVYFGSVAIRKTRHAIAAGLVADATGVIASVLICRLVFG